MIRPVVSSLALSALERRDKPASPLSRLKYPVLVLVGAAGLFFAELGSFRWALRRCRIDGVSDQAQVFVAISDIHILGSHGTDLEMMWTTYQARKILALIMRWIRPSAVFILGDHLDRGGSATEEDWDALVKRFRWATEPLRGYDDVTVVDSVMGNHDAQFAHLGLTNSMLDRFVNTFGSANGAIRVGPHVEAIWINALTVHDETHSKGHVETMQLLDELERDAQESKPFRILLSHVPPFRINDMDCGKSRLREGEHIAYVPPNEPLRPGLDVLTPETSRKLLTAVRPDVMLSGHLHSHCYRKNQYEDVILKQNTSFLDITVPSFSYKLRPDPGFTLLVVDNMQAHGKTCKLPSVRVILGLDFISLLIIGLAVCMWLFECRFFFGRRSKVE